MSVINLDHIIFDNGDKVLIPELSLTIPERETLILAGSVESGRSLLVKIIAGILPPTGGRILYDEIDLYDSDPEEIKKIKRQIGFAFQYEGLLSNLTIEENILLPIKFFDAEAVESYYERINELLDFFAVKDTWLKRPAEVSIQKKKILAYIRSIIVTPKILFIDDPYFSLDQFYQNRIMDSIKKMKESGLTLVIITNSNEIISELADKVLFFRNGKIEKELYRDQITLEKLKSIESTFIRY